MIFLYSLSRLIDFSLMVRELNTDKLWECFFSNALVFPSALGDQLQPEHMVLAQYPEEDGSFSSTLYPATVLSLDTDDPDSMVLQFRRDKRIVDVPHKQIAFLTRKMRGKGIQFFGCSWLLSWILTCFNAGPPTTTKKGEKKRKAEEENGKDGVDNPAKVLKGEAE